jgi:hypothetical protein
VIDTQAKRMSAMFISSPWRPLLPLPGSGFERPDRLVFLYLYRNDARDGPGGVFDPPIFDGDPDAVFLPHIAIPNKRILLESDFVRSNLVARLRQRGYIIIFVPRSGSR